MKMNKVAPFLFTRYFTLTQSSLILNCFASIAFLLIIFLCQLMITNFKMSFALNKPSRLLDLQQKIRKRGAFPNNNKGYAASSNSPLFCLFKSKMYAKGRSIKKNQYFLKERFYSCFFSLKFDIFNNLYLLSVDLKYF